MTCGRVGIFAFVIFAVGISIVHAQVFGGVRVTVRDVQGLAGANADVALKAETSAPLQSERPNTQGEAVFPAVPLGHYVVPVTFEGFAPGEKQIAVASNVTTPLLIQL